MRHAAVTLARAAVAAWDDGQRWDILLCSDMLDLAQFQGLSGSRLNGLPTVAYFHENQLTYPQRTPNERDLHFAFTNFVSALAANQVWFNSAFHRSDFISSLSDWLAHMPDFQPHEQIREIREKSQVQSPGVATCPPAVRRLQGPLRIAWAARWEHDKNPETFFEALRLLGALGADFRLMVFGQSFREVPTVFLEARREFSNRIEHWGFVSSHDEYLRRMAQADVFVSTAVHEFFGLAAVEAISLGLHPLLPARLAYPELLGLDTRADDPRPARHGRCGESPCHLAGNQDSPPTPASVVADFYYDGTASELAQQLARLAEDPYRIVTVERQNALRSAADRFNWARRQ